MDWLDFLVKFSGEAVVVAVALTVALMNLSFFTGGAGKTYSDNSLAAKFLSYHPDANRKLYAKNSSIVTTVAKSGGFIAQAQADELVSLSNASASAQPPQNADNVLDGSQDILSKPNPDSIQALVAKQVKIYQTLPGDTVKSLAAANGILPQTIMWANNLPNGNLKPGWFLLILPTDGILVTADSNTTLPDLAAQYNPEKYNPNKTIRDDSAAKLLDTIISYDGLVNAEDIDAGQVVIIPGGRIVEQPKPKPAPKPKTKSIPGNGASDAVTSIGSGYDGENHLFPKGYCTYYVASRMTITFGGNAKNWLANARASGYVVNQEAAPRTAVVTTDSRRWGHVAYVEQVTDTAILVSEMNFDHFNRVNQRWIPKNSPTIRGYIYP